MTRRDAGLEERDGLHLFLWGFLGYFAALILLTGIFSPATWHLAEAAGTPFSSFRRAFDATVTVTALALLIPLLRFWGLRQWQDFFGAQSRIGVGDWRALPREWLTGFAIATTIALGLVGLYLALGWRTWMGGASLSQVITDFLLCTLLGLHEEFLFRGVFFLGALALVGRWWKSWAVLHALFFAFGHYLKAKPLAGEVTWLSGWQTWTTVATGINWPECVNTALLGITLCLLAKKTGRLWMGLGLHGGLVFWIRHLHSVTALGVATPLAVVGANLRSGWMPTLVLAALTIAAWKICARLPQEKTHVALRKNHPA